MFYLSSPFVSVLNFCLGFDGNVGPFQWSKLKKCCGYLHAVPVVETPLGCSSCSIGFLEALGYD